MIRAFRDAAVSPGMVRLCQGLAAAGTLALAFGCWLAPARAWASVLQASVLLVQIGLGGALFLALHHLTGARWSRPLLPVPAALTALLPAGGIGVLLVLLIYPSLYPWSHHEVEHPASAWFREGWLWRPGVLLRAAAYLGLWLWLARKLTARPDRPGRWAGVFVVVFAVTCWLSSVDWIMSLEGEWSSTIFGVYHFAGLYLATLAAIVVVLAWLQSRSALREPVTTEQFHDLGKLLFGFSCFWAYIWFCQYMLIWYVNNPEETGYYVRRLHAGWGPLFLLNVALGWVVPFLVLMSRRAKRDLGVLVKVSAVVLVGRVLDLYLLVQPAIEETPAFGVPEIGITAGGIGVGLLVLFAALKGASRTTAPVAVDVSANGEVADTNEKGLDPRPVVAVREGLTAR